MNIEDLKHLKQINSDNQSQLNSFKLNCFENILFHKEFNEKESLKKATKTEIENKKNLIQNNIIFLDKYCSFCKQYGFCLNNYQIELFDVFQQAKLEALKEHYWNILDYINVTLPEIRTDLWQNNL